jgi:GTP-binding protein
MQIRDVVFVKGAVKWPDLPEDGLPEVAFLGRSNVGTSSFINMLVGRMSGWCRWTHRPLERKCVDGGREPD